jgi:hypothetical protein
MQEKLVPNLQTNSIIVVDNEPYHNEENLTLKQQNEWSY